MTAAPTYELEPKQRIQHGRYERNQCDRSITYQQFQEPNQQFQGPDQQSLAPNPRQDHQHNNNNRVSPSNYQIREPHPIRENKTINKHKSTHIQVNIQETKSRDRLQISSLLAQLMQKSWQTRQLFKTSNPSSLLSISPQKTSKCPS